MSLMHVIRTIPKKVRAVVFGPRPVDEAPGPSEELEATARDLRRNLEPYLNKPDPLAALMTDIFNKRTLARGMTRRGNGDWNES